MALSNSCFKEIPAHAACCGKILSSVERGLLFNLQGSGSLLPKTAGVNYQYQEYESTRVFALAGFPSALGTGDINDPDVGGFLSNIIR